MGSKPLSEAKQYIPPFQARMVQQGRMEFCSSVKVSAISPYFKTYLSSDFSLVYATCCTYLSLPFSCSRFLQFCQPDVQLRILVPELSTLLVKLRQPDLK
jgi:hypothetical protein